MDTVNKQAASGRIKGPEGYLYIENNGNETSPEIPVLFLHAYTGSHEQWKEQLDHLRQNRKAAAFDFRGHGQSDTSRASNYSVESLVKDVEAAIDKLGWDQLVLVGHSMGGSTAVAYADAHPNRVAGLLLTGAPGRSAPEQSKQIMASLESQQYNQVMDSYMKKLLTGASSHTNSSVMNGYRKISKDASLQIIRGQFAYNPLPAINRYKGPITIVYADAEKDQPNALYNQVDDAISKKRIEGTSHWMQMDKPEQFNQIMDEFLQMVDDSIDKRLPK